MARRYRRNSGACDTLASLKALIKVGYGCNENCTFCHTADVRHIDGSAAEVHTKIRRAKALGHSMVVLSGGEPTIRPELLPWASHVASLGMDFGLVTNGLMLSYPDLVQRLLERRLRYVYMSLHGGKAEVHNRIVRTSAFGSAVQALRNLSGLGLDLTVNTVVTRQNLHELRAVVDLVLPHQDVTLKFSMLQPKGGGERLFSTLMPRVSEVASRVSDAIDYGIRRTGERGPRFAHDGIPLCLLPGHESRYDDLKTHDFRTMVEIGEPDFYPVDDRDKVQPAACGGCSLSGACPGLFRTYHALFGTEELRPVRDRARPNSFNYVFETMVAASHEGGCPLLSDGTAPWDRGRHLFVKNGTRMARFHARSRDFSDLEIDSIKHASGQLYLDVSDKAAPNDFPVDLLKLERSEMCGGCPKREGCTGMFEPVPDHPFAREEKRVRRVLEELRGDVLDVGCGEGVHEDILEALATSGKIRYVGLDPDAGRLNELRARRSWGELHVGTAEGIDDSARFDAVLALRSWNHFRDPARAIGALCRALRPGGMLMLVDNEAFGLARTVAQAQRAEGSSAAFEHYRNDGAEEVATLARSFPLRLVERHDVGASTSNQWLLRYRRWTWPRWTAGVRLGPARQGALWPFDPEIVAFELGLRKLIKRELEPGEDDAPYTEVLVARGLRVRRVGGSLLAARDQRLLDRAEEAELASVGKDSDARRFLGAALGYPACCVERFVTEPIQDDLAVARARLAPLSLPASPLTLWLGPLTLLGHVPCSAMCESSRSLGESTLARLDELRPGFAVAWLELARRVHVFGDGGAFALELDGEVAAGGTRIRQATELVPCELPGEIAREAPSLAGALLVIDPERATADAGGWHAELVADHSG
jgi:MoaA/NifB/PqqE/SkfB family radical SAM enzyme/SAM-dependent methyltransferase